MALYDVSARLVLESVDSSSVQRAVSSVNTRLDKGTKSAKAFYDAASLKGINLAGYAALGGAMAKIGMVVASATHDAIRFDQELAKLAQTIGISNKDIKEHSESIRKMSVAYGLSAPKIAETIRVLAQAGYSLNEAKAAADNLAQTTLLASFESISNTTEGLIAINKQFTETVGQSARVLSLLNVVAKKYAVESDDLVDAAKRAGGVFAATGGSLEELVTIYTTVRDTTRESSETISTGLRTIFSRLQRPKTIDYLRQFGIELTDLKGNFIGNYQAIIEIQKGIERANISPGSLQFSEIVEQLGGVLQQSRVIPLLTQAAKMQRIYADAQNASSETAADLAKAQETLSFKLAQTQQNFAKLIGDVMETSSFKAMISTVLSLTNAFIGFAGSIKELIPLLATFAAIKLSKSLLGIGLPSIGRGKAPIRRASGGFVPGSGSGDTVPAMLEPGEFVIRKSAAQAMGADALHGINRYAKGGPVRGDALGSSTIRSRVVSQKSRDEEFKTGQKINSEDSLSFNKIEMGIPGGKRNPKEFEKYAAYYLKKYKGFSGIRLSSGLNDPIDLIGGSYPIEVRSRTEFTNDNKLLDKFLRWRLDTQGNIVKNTSKAGESLSVPGKVGIVYNTDKLSEEKLAGRGVRQLRRKKTEKFASGGPVGTDTVPALLTPGEFVVNKESAQAFGYGNLEEVNKYASGGYVSPQKMAKGGRPNSFRPPRILYDGVVDPPQARASSGASDAARTGAFSALDDLDKEVNKTTTSFSDLAFVAAGVASQYTDSESAISRAIGTTLEFVSTAALAVSALELFGVSLNAKNISSFLSGGFKGIATKTSKLLATSVGGPSIVSASTSTSMAAFGGAVVTTTAAVAAAGVAFYAAGSVIDSFRGLTEATNKAIAEGNAAKAAEAATYEASQSVGSIFAAGIGVAAAAIASFAVGVAAIPALIIGGITALVLKFSLMSDAGAGFLTKLRDLGASFGALESSASIAAKASLDASLQNVDTVRNRNSEALSKQVSKVTDKQGADEVLGGGLVKENASSVGAAKREIEKNRRIKEQEMGAISETGLIGQGIDAISQVFGGESLAATSERLAKEIAENQAKFEERAQAAFAEIAPLVDTNMAAFTDVGGSDWTTFLNSLSPAAREIIELAGNGSDLANQLSDMAEAAKTDAALRAILNAQMLKLTETTSGLAEANRKGMAASQLGSTIAGLSSSGFRTSSLSNAASSEDVNKQISAAKALGVTGYDENVSNTIRGKSELADLEKKFSLAAPTARKALAEQIQAKKKDIIEGAGGSTEGLSDKAINEAFDSVTSSADALQEKLVSASTNVETGINKFIDSLSEASKAQTEYAAASNEAGRSARGRDADLQSFRVGGSTVEEIQARQAQTQARLPVFPLGNTKRDYKNSTENMNRIGKEIVAREVAATRPAPQLGQIANIGAMINPQAIAAVNANANPNLLNFQPNAAPPIDTIDLQFQFSALQTAAEQQAAKIREETSLREDHIEAIKEELSLEKDRAQTIEEFNIALSGGAGRDAEREAKKKLRSLQRVENARLTGGEAAANKEIGRAINRNGGDRSFYTGIQAPATAQQLERNASATGGQVGFRRLGPNSELGQNLNNVGQTGFTAQGAILAGRVGSQNREINANDAALVEGMRLHSKMLSSSAAMFNQSIISMTGGLGQFSKDMAVILDGLKGASFDLKMQGGNVSVDISDKSGVVGMISDAAKKQISDMIAEAIRGKEMGAL